MEDIELGLFPISIRVKNINEFPIKDSNIVSFKKVNVEIPFFSIFSQIKTVNINVLNPTVVFNEQLFQKSTSGNSIKGFKINKINIINGNLIYNTSKLYLNLVKFNLITFPKENKTIYRITSPHLKIVFPFSGKPMTIEGQIVGEFRRQGQNWKIIKLNWQTPETIFNFNGRVFRDGRFALNVYTQGSARQLLDELLGNLSIRDFMYGDFQILRNKQKKITLRGKMRARTFKIKDESFKHLEASINWDNIKKAIRVNTTFLDGNSKVKLRVKSKNKVVEVSAENANATKIAHIIDIYDIVPIAGTIKKSHFSIHKNIIKGNVQLEQLPILKNPNQFNSSGDAQFFYNSRSKSVQVSSKNLQTEFGNITDLNIISTPKKKTQLSINLRSTISESAFLDKYSVYFINMPLAQWEFRKGKGLININLKKIDKDFFIKADINLRDFYSDQEKISSLTGYVETDKEITKGRFSLNDKNLNGEVKLTHNSNEGNYILHLNKISGEAKKILNILDLNLDLYGQIQGDYIYSVNKSNPGPILTGTFQSDNVIFYDFNFQNLKSNLEYRENTNTIILNNLKANYMKGECSVDLTVDYSKQKYKTNGYITNINLNQMHNHFKGSGDIVFNGEGDFEQTPIELTYKTSEIYFYQDQCFRLQGKAKIFTNFSDHYYLETQEGKILNNDILSSMALQLNQISGQFDGQFQGNISDINLLIPWGDNQGQININGRIFSRPNGDIGVQGYANFKGKYLSFPNVAQTIDDFSGDLIFNDLDFTLRSLRGKLGDGNVNCNGSLVIKENKLDHLFISLSGEKMNVNIIDRSSFNMDVDINLKYIDEKLLLSGNFDIHSGHWEREVDEGISFYTDPSLSASGSSIMDILQLDLKIKSKENVRAINSLGEVVGKLNLKLTGDYKFPVLSGTIESRNGFINFSGKKFDLIKGKIKFSDFISNPELDIESEAFIKNYRIKFNIKGTTSKIKPELQSSPPLPVRDILTLISIGELFRRPTSEELSSQIGTGTTSLIFSELTEQIKKGTKKIFGDYLLTIAPNISANTSSGTPEESYQQQSRLIVGKEISKDFLIVYSTNFSTQRQEVVYVQYQLSPNISLIGMRNEEGRYSLDIRFRKRKQ